MNTFTSYVLAILLSPLIAVVLLLLPVIMAVYSIAQVIRGESDPDDIW